MSEGEKEAGETSSARTDVRPSGRTFAAASVLPQVVALSAVALVGAVDVGTLLTAGVGQTLIHIWRLEVRANYCHGSADQKIKNQPIIFLLVGPRRRRRINRPMPREEPARVVSPAPLGFVKTHADIFPSTNLKKHMTTCIDTLTWIRTHMSTRTFTVAAIAG